MQTPNNLAELLAVQKRISDYRREITIIRYKSSLVRGRYNRRNKSAYKFEGLQAAEEIKEIELKLEELIHYLDPVSAEYYYYLVDDAGQRYFGKRHESPLGACSGRNKLVRKLLEGEKLVEGGRQACKMNPRDLVTTVGDYREWGIYKRRINRK